MLAPIYALAAADRLVRTGVATAQEVDVSDLDPTQRAGWTAEQWQRAEAAGLLSLAVAPADDGEEEAARETTPTSQLSQLSPAADDDEPVWWDNYADEWRTHYPPPDDFDGTEQYEPDHVNYERSLTPAEAAAMGPGPFRFTDAELAALAAERDAWFARTPHAADPPIN